MLIPSTLITLLFSLILPLSTVIADEISLESNFDISQACQIGFETGYWKDCANSLSTLIWNTHTWYDDQPITICKLKCTRKLQGHVSDFQWVWDATFQCGSEIRSQARGFRIRRHAMKHAIAETIEQAITFGHLTPNDFQCDQSSKEEHIFE